MEGVKRERENAVENERNREMEILVLFFILKFCLTLTYSGTSGSGGKVWPPLVM
jgi:H+/Cl- antiporter ClcA